MKTRNINKDDIDLSEADLKKIGPSSYPGICSLYLNGRYEWFYKVEIERLKQEFAKITTKEEKEIL
jgi:hypothetical protein